MPVKNGHGLSPAAEKKRILKARHKKMAEAYKKMSPAQKKHYNKGQAELRKIAKFFNESDKGVKPKGHVAKKAVPRSAVKGVKPKVHKSKTIAPKRFARKIMLKKYKKLAGAKVAKKVAGKSLARKVVGKLGVPGKIAVGASIFYQYSKKTGCGPGMSKVTKDGKTYCKASKGSRKGRDY